MTKYKYTRQEWFDYFQNLDGCHITQEAKEALFEPADKPKRAVNKDNVQDFVDLYNDKPKEEKMTQNKLLKGLSDIATDMVIDDLEKECNHRPFQYPYGTPSQLSSDKGGATTKLSREGASLKHTAKVRPTDKPKEEAYFTSPIFKEDLICPKCLGRNGCMCALKPKETGKDLIKRKIKEGKQKQDLLTKTYFEGLEESLAKMISPTPLKTKPEIECIHEGNTNNFNPQFCYKCGEEFMYNRLSTPSKEIKPIEKIDESVEHFWFGKKINEIIDYLNK